MEKIEKYPQLEVEVELPDGSRIATLKVFSDLGLFKDADNYVREVLKNAIYNSVDRIFVRGIYGLMEDIEKNNKKPN